MSTERAIQLQEHAWMLHAERRLDEACVVCREALRLLEESEGPDSLDVANLLNDAAEIENDRHNFDAAVALAERAGAIEDAFGEASEEAAVARNNLAVLYKYWSSPAETRPHVYRWRTKETATDYIRKARGRSCRLQPASIGCGGREG